jgi:hypothetical protein
MTYMLFWGLLCLRRKGTQGEGEASNSLREREKKRDRVNLKHARGKCIDPEKYRGNS